MTGRLEDDTMKDTHAQAAAWLVLNDLFDIPPKMTKRIQMTF